MKIWVGPLPIDELVNADLERRAPAAEFIGAEQVVDGQVAVFPVDGDLFGGESRMHAVLLGLGLELGIRVFFFLFLGK